ncbi:MAG: TonB-dependent receptor [Sphingomonas sp.]
MQVTRADKAALRSGGSLVALTVSSLLGTAAAAQTPPAPSAIAPQVEASPLAQAAVTTSADQTAPSPAPAANSRADERIVITGFRASLHNALSDKRRSNVQIDEINAQDIAEFPDANLAESLQRLPGVSIDRDNGEGRSITVRGLGGDFNVTRIDGLEALSTAGANDAGTSPNRSRAFDYNTFASELFTSLKVQKTASAETDEGSLGANIDLQTARPFDYKGRTFALSTEGSYQKNSKTWSPRIAGLASTRFFGGKMGLLVSAAYSKSNNAIDQYARQPGQADYLYRSTDFAGNENPPRAGFSAPVGTTFFGPTSATNGTIINQVTNPDALAVLTGSDPTAYANLYPGAPYNTPGRFDDSTVRIPALASLQQQDVRYRRLGVTAAYQWQISDRTRLSIDGLMSRFHNVSTNNQISSVGLNRNNTNATYNTANNRLNGFNARTLYPGLCTPNAGSDTVPAQDCGLQLYGRTPAFSTALNSSGQLVPSILGAYAVDPSVAAPANAAARNADPSNIFSSNRFNLDPYDYYNNPNSVGYIPTSNRLAFRGNLIGRPGVDVLQSHVQNGVADYLVLRNVDFRSAVDQSDYTTKFWQGSANLSQQFTDKLKGEFIYGRSKSTLAQTGLLVEFNRMDSPGLFTYDERDHGNMPVIDFGFDAANPTNWDTVKGFSAIRHFERDTTNTFRTVRGDFDWRTSDRFGFNFGAIRRKYGFETEQWERNNDLLNPTLKEAGVNPADVGRVIQFGQGLNPPEGTATSFFVPTIAGFQRIFDFTCNCVNKWGDWRITNLRNGGRENFSVDETDTAGYLQADWNLDLLGGSFRGNAGVRVAHTDLESVGHTTAGRETVGTNKYTDWLPSLNLVYEPVRNLLFRFGASKVMARPLLGNLSPTVSNISIPNTGASSGATLTVGNPKLSPFRATNLDASVEWYFGKGSLISLAGFNKKIKSFPQTVQFSAPLSAFLEPDLIAALKQQFAGDAPRLAYLEANNDFQAQQFRDAPGGYLRGVEFSYQQDFTFLPGLLKNFGAILNYTYIKSELNYIVDPQNNITGKAPFLGVSPQALNATLYYESSRFHARVSVAHRKGYSTTYPIAGGSCSPGIIPGGPALPPGVLSGNNTPGGYCTGPLVNDFVTSGATTNVDFSVSYKVTDYLTLTAEGLNVTNQASNRYAYSANPVVTQYASSGPIYRVGARWKF